MDLPKGMPFLTGLSKVELAKLMPNLEMVTLDEGQLLDSREGAGQAVYCIRDGWAEVVEEVGEDAILLVALGPGDSFGPLLGDEVYTSGRIRARSPMKLVRVPKKVLQELCTKHPQVFSAVSRQLSNRVTSLERELVRTKLMVAAHANELWGSQELEPLEFTDEADAFDQVAATAHAVPPAEPERRHQPVLRLVNLLQRTIPWLLAGSLVPFIFLRAWLGVSDAATVMVVLAWGALNWYLARLPDYGVAMAMVAALASLRIAPASVTLSGFTSETWFLVLGIYGLGAAVNRTGLLYRFALFVLRWLPPTYRGQALALALTGLFLTPALPSSNGRVTMASPLAHELATAMRLQPRSKESAGLALSVLHGFGQMYFLFMNGTGNCLVVWGLLPPSIRQNVSWLSWFVTALPLGLVIFLGFFGALMWLVPNKAQTGISRRILDIQASTLGPLNRMERITLAVTVGVLLAFVLQPLYGLHPAWLAIAGLLILLAARVIDRTTFVSSIDWASLVMFGALWSLAGLIRQVGLDTELGAVAAVLLKPAASHPWVYLVVLGLMTYLVRLVIPWESAIPLMMVAATPVLLAAGYNPFIGGLVILATSNPFFVPQQNIVYLTVHAGTGEQDITHSQAARFGIIHAGITLLAIIISSIIWGLTGAMKLG